jgi:hypothetical protein
VKDIRGAMRGTAGGRYEEHPAVDAKDIRARREEHPAVDTKNIRAGI